MNRIIAICGKPTSGKSEAARILQEKFGAVIVDDGMILRRAAPELFQGVTLNDCLTQEGKRKEVEVAGKTYSIRKLLGDLGQILEDHFGEFFVPDQAMKRIATLPPAPYYVLSACRKRQGHFYRQQGGIVFEMDRDVPESPHAFDWYDKTACHATIPNRADIPALEVEIAKAMLRYFNDPAGALALGADKLPASGKPQVDIRDWVESLKACVNIAGPK